MRVLSIFFGLITAPIITHALQPSDRGQLGAIVALFALLPIVFDFGVATELRRKFAIGELGGTNRIVTILTLLSLSGSALFGWLFMIFLLPIPELQISGSIFAGCIAAGLSVFLNIAQVKLLQAENYRAIFVLRISQPSAYFALILVGGIFHLISLEFASWSAALSILVSCIVALKWAPAKGKTEIKIKQLVRPGFFFWIATLGEFLLFRLDQLLALPAVGVHEAGLYMIATIIITLPADILGLAVGSRHFKAVANSRASEKDIAKALYESLALGSVLVVAMLALSPIIVPLVFGVAYSAVSGIVTYGAAGSLFMVVFKVLSQLATSRNFGRGLAAACWSGAIVDSAFIFVLHDFGAVGATLASTLGFLVSLIILGSIMKVKFSHLKSARVSFASTLASYFGFEGEGKSSLRAGKSFSIFKNLWSRFVEYATWLRNILLQGIFIFLPIRRSQILIESNRGRGGSDSPEVIADSLRFTDKTLKFICVSESPEPKFNWSHRVVKHGSISWLWAIYTSSALILNNGMPFYFHKKKGQLIVQTWHGVPFKKIGLDVPKHLKGSVKRGAKMFRRDTKSWDLLLSSSEFNSKVFRSAFDFEGLILASGLPRNDILFHPGATRETTRSKLGLAPDDLFVLYAPTWRDIGTHQKDMDLLIQQFSKARQTNWFLGLKTHWLDTDDFLSSSQGLINLGQYPTIEELYLASDLLVTDYSSVMFDYSLTGKQIVFYVPDLGAYLENRGSYFDLHNEAPGPVYSEASKVVEAFKTAQSMEFALKKLEWRSKFTSFENGDATKRVVNQITKLLRT